MSVHNEDKRHGGRAKTRIIAYGNCLLYRHLSHTYMTTGTHHNDVMVKRAVPDDSEYVCAIH